MSRVVKHQCPFCGEWVKHYDVCNGFCTCSAKYYSQDKVWLNRKTGEERRVHISNDFTPQKDDFSKEG